MVFVNNIVVDTKVVKHQNCNISGSKLLPIPNFGKIQAVEADPTVQENIIDIVPFQERQKRMRSKFIPDPTIVNALENAIKDVDVSKFESEEQIQEVIAKDAQKLIFENPLIKDEISNINLARVDDFKKIADDLAKKYDLNDKDQHLKANEELNQQVNEVILKDLANSKIFKEIGGSVDASLNDVFSRKGKEFTGKSQRRHESDQGCHRQDHRCSREVA